MDESMTGKSCECWREEACFEQREWGKRAQWTKTATHEVRGREKPREPRGTWATEAHTSTPGSLAGPEEELAECFPLAVALVPLSKVILRKGLKKGDKRGRCAKVKEHWQTCLLLLTNVISTPLCLNTPITTQAPDVGGYSACPQRSRSWAFSSQGTLQVLNHYKLSKGHKHRFQ